MAFFQGVRGLFIEGGDANIANVILSVVFHRIDVNYVSNDLNVEGLPNAAYA